MRNFKNIYNFYGFTYLGLLFLITLMGLSLALAGSLYSFAQKRENERQLIFIGNQFKQAISLYYHRSPGSFKRYPQQLQDLIQDNRFLGVQRHLRKIYTDPITKTKDWGLVIAPDGGVMGIYSKSTDLTLNVFEKSINGFALPQNQRYIDWKFIYVEEGNQSLLDNIKAKEFNLRY